jgi:hypothetical protein
MGQLESVLAHTLAADARVAALQQNYKVRDDQ